MAGYMTKPQTYKYEGECINGTTAAVQNGVLLVRGTGANVNKLVLPTADTTSKFVCKEVTNIYGMPAYRFVYEAEGDATYYFVENGFEVNDDEEYDTTAYATKVGGFLRAHPLVRGDEFVTTMVTGSIAAGTAYGVKATGTIG